MNQSPSREEGLLHDILLELDRERNKRAESEAKLRSILDENRKLKAAQTSISTHQPTMHDMITMKTEVEGYRQLIDALTTSNPAIRAAKKQEAIGVRSCIPTHVVRLLEVMPYDLSVREHILKQERVVEWQMRQGEIWQANLAAFPLYLKSLPVMSDTKASNTQVGARNVLNLLVHKNSLPCGVVTDFAVRQRIDARQGYSLPTDGTQWQWIASWSIDRDPNECDVEGWSYSDAVPATKWKPRLDGSPATDFRRRVWMRQRVLIDYPQASERTRHYLRLLAENVQYAMAANKISNQLIETKLALTETEDLMEKTKTELSAEVQDLEAKVMKQHALLKAAGVDDELLESLPNTEHDHAGLKGLQDYLANNEIAVKEIGNRLSHLASSAKKTGHDLAKRAEEGSKDLTGALVNRIKKQKHTPS